MLEEFKIGDKVKYSKNGRIMKVWDLSIKNKKKRVGCSWISDYGTRKYGLFLSENLEKIKEQ
jgi:uncharacterized protein YodC (DUF2158 family)